MRRGRSARVSRSPRVGILGWTIACVLVALVALVGPFVTLVVAGRSVAGASRFLKEGGLPNLLVLFLHVVCAVVVGALGPFVVRGKRIPPAVLGGVAILPLLASVLGAIWGQGRTYGAVAGESVSLGMKLRILAEGFAEANTATVLGSASGAVLAGAASLALLASVLDVDTRRMSPPKHAAWILGTGVGAALLVIALVARLLSPSWGGGVGAKLGFVVVLVAAALAGPVRARVVALDEGQDRAELGRVTAALIAGALLLGLSALLFDRAAFGIVERLVLGAISGESVDPSQRMRILGEVAPGVPATRLSMIVDALATTLAFAPAIAAAIKRPAWGHVGATFAVVAACALALLGGNRYRQGKLDRIFSAMKSAQAELPDLVVIPPDELENRADDATEVNVVVLASGETKTVRPSSGFGRGLVVAPDRKAPFAALFEVARAGASASRTYRAVDASQARTILAGRDGPPLASAASGLGAYAPFLESTLVGYPVRIAKQPDVLSSDTLYVLATGPGHARVALVQRFRQLPSEAEVSFADPSAARKQLATLTSLGNGGAQIVLAPLPDARVEDVYAMLGVLHRLAARGRGYDSYGYSSSGTNEITIVADRDAVTAAMRGSPRPPPRSLGADTR